MIEILLTPATLHEAALLAAAVIAAVLSLLAALALFDFLRFDDGVGEPVLTAKPEPRRVRAGQPPVDLDACERAGRAAAFADFDHGGVTENPEIRHSKSASRWAIGYERTKEALENAHADSMLPAP